MAKYPIPGSQHIENNTAKLDISHIDNGYVIAHVYDSNPAKKFKIRQECGGKSQDYNGHPFHAEIYIPLVYGSGKYTISIWRNREGTKYDQQLQVRQDVILKDVLSPWLYPTAYSEYFPSSVCVREAALACQGKTVDVDKLQAIASAVIDALEYDRALAAEVSNVDSFFVPAPDTALAKRKGICFEYASLTAAMCRSQDIPCKIAVGRACGGGGLHAWNEVYCTNGGNVRGVPINAACWSLLDLTWLDSGVRVAAGNYTVEYYG